MTKISVVTSLYHSAPYLKEFWERHRAALDKIGVEHEFILVNDGSPDESESIAITLAMSDARIKVISLSRNFGQHAAMFAGLAHATGDFIYATDSDLEEAPENIEILYQSLRNDPDSDVYYGVTTSRTGDFFKNQCGKFFYTMLDFLSDVKIPRNQAWQRIMTKRYVDALLSYKETETLPAGLMILAGFKQVPLVIEKHFKGGSSYSPGRRLRLAIHSIVSFSSRPLILVGFTGIGISFIALMFLIATIFQKLFLVDFQAGWVSVIASIWLVGGLILSSIGIIGLYLSRIFNQVKDRPLYIVKQIITKDASPKAPAPHQQP